MKITTSIKVGEEVSMVALGVGVVVGARGGHEGDVVLEETVRVIDAVSFSDRADEKTSAEGVEGVFSSAHAVVIVDTAASPELPFVMENNAADNVAALVSSSSLGGVCDRHDAAWVLSRCWLIVSDLAKHPLDGADVVEPVHRHGKGVRDENAPEESSCSALECCHLLFLLLWVSPCFSVAFVS